MRYLVAALLSLFAATATVVADTPRQGGTMVYMSGKIPSFNPLHGQYNVGLVSSNIFASLTRLNEKNEVSPYLAESYSVSDDGLTYTFNLAKNARFHDGEPVTAEDVEFSLGIILEKHRFGPQMFGPIETIETPDDHTVILRLSQPHGPLLLAATSPRQLPIMPKHVYGEGDFSTNPAHKNPVGSGPFRLKEHKIDEYVLLERDENHFHEGFPLLDQIIFRVVTDKTAMRVGLQRNQFHLAQVAVVTRYGDIKNFEKIPHLALTRVASPGGGAAILEFNHRDERFANVKVRQAIAHAVDNEYIANVFHGGWTRASVGPFPHTNVFFDESIKGREYDVEKANRLLDEAGYPRGDDGVRFEMKVLYIAPPHEPDVQIVLGEYIGVALKEVGIKVIQESMPGAAAWSKRMADWSHETSIILAGDKVDPAIGIGRLYRCDNIKNQAYTNTSGYCNPELDELFVQGAMEANFDKRKAIYSEAQRILLEEMPLFWLTDSTNLWFNHKDLHFPSYGYGEFWGEVYWKTPQE